MSRHDSLWNNIKPMQLHFNTQPLARWRHSIITKWRVSKWLSWLYNSCAVGLLAQGSMLSVRWRHCVPRNHVVVGLLAQDSMLSVRWRHCVPRNHVVVGLLAQGSMLSVRWRHCVPRNHVVGLLAQSSMLSVRWWRIQECFIPRRVQNAPTSCQSWVRTVSFEFNLKKLYSLVAGCLWIEKTQKPLFSV